MDTKYANKMHTIYEEHECSEAMKNPGNKLMWPVNMNNEFDYPDPSILEMFSDTRLLATHLELQVLEKDLGKEDPASEIVERLYNMFSEDRSSPSVSNDSSKQDTPIGMKEALFPNVMISHSPLSAAAPVVSVAHHVVNAVGPVVKPRHQPRYDHTYCKVLPAQRIKRGTCILIVIFLCFSAVCSHQYNYVNDT